MADSKVEIEVTADTKGVKKGMAEVEAATEKAMEAGANSAKKLAKAIDDVEKSQKKLAEESKLTAQNLKGIASGMASMAMGVAGVGLRMGGHEREGAYLGGAAAGAAQGAGMMAPLGGAGMLAGAIGGGLLGFVKTGLEREEQGKQEAAAMGDLADALEKAREKMQAAKERADGFAGTLDRLGDVSRSTNEREAERAAEIEKRQNAVADATERMAAAEKALRDQAAAIDGPQTEEQKKAADKIREAWADANQELQTAQAELDRLKDAKVEAAKPAKTEPLDKRGDGPQLSNLEKLGASFGGASAATDFSGVESSIRDALSPLEPIASGFDGASSRLASAASGIERLSSGFGAATESLARDGNEIAMKQLDVLRAISEKTGAPATFA